MKKILHILAVTSFALLSCERTTSTSTSITAADSACIYFDLRNESEFVLDTNVNCINIEVRRYGKTEEMDIPIILEKEHAMCLKVPPVVHFAKGEDRASIAISTKEIPLSKPTNLEISIGNDFASDKISSLGCKTWQATVTRGIWHSECDSACVDFKEKYSTQYCKVYKMDGQNIYRINDFLHSGHDLIYKIGIEEVDGNGEREIIPINLGYYVCNSDEGTSIIHMWSYDSWGGVGAYMSWKPQVDTTGITRCYIYNYSPEAWFSFANEYTDKENGKKTVMMCLYFWMYYDDGSSGWNPMTIIYPGELPQAKEK